MIALDPPVVDSIGPSSAVVGDFSPAPDVLVPFNTVLLYENVETARRAVAASLKLAVGLNPGGHVTQKVWRFDLLDRPNCRAASLADAFAADAVIVSSLSATLPAGVISWLNACKAEARNTGLIVVLLSGTGDSWTIVIRHPAEFSGTRAGFVPALEQTFHCGYRAALPEKRCL